MSENIPALIAEARERHRRTARHLPDPTSPTLVSRLADALESLSAPPATDDEREALHDLIDGFLDNMPDGRCQGGYLSEQLLIAGWRPPAAPLTVEAVAEAIDIRYDDYRPRFNAEGTCVGSNIADAVVARFSLPEPAETEWEYGLADDGATEPYSDISTDRDWVLDGVHPMDEGTVLLRRRAPGPWVPVEKGAEG